MRLHVRAFRNFTIIFELPDIDRHHNEQSHYGNMRE